MSRSIMSVVTAVTLLGAVTALSACNTVAGAGKDVSSAGSAVTNTADKAKSQ